MNIVEKVDYLLPVKRVLVSVSDKSGLAEFVQSLIKINPDILFLSTGGTHAAIAKALGEESAKRHLASVDDYTGTPEMQGGLVKTLNPVIHAGLLGERHNLAHQEYLIRLSKDIKFVSSPQMTSTDGLRLFDAPLGEYQVRVVERAIEVGYIDMTVVNLYPFESTIAKPGTTFEQARANIDIGGPAMIRASAKNFHSCAVVVNPESYGFMIDLLRGRNGNTTLNTRFDLAQSAFKHTAEYDAAIAKYLLETHPDTMEKCYKIENWKR